MTPERDRTVMVVDDDEQSLEILTTFLEMEGFAAIGQADGDEAFAYLRSHRSPDVILLDLLMPRIDGWTFSRMVREDPNLAAIPIVIMSASPQARRQAGLIPAAQFLDKPIDFDDLLDAIRKSSA